MANGATEFMDVTTEAAFIPTIWSKYVIRAREQKLLFARLVNRKYEDDASYGATINIPNVSHLTTGLKNLSANTAVNYETVTEVSTQITIGTWAYSAIAVESATKKQSYKDLMQLYAPEQGYALGLRVDDDLAALVDDLTTNQTGTMGSAVTFEQFKQARRMLNDANVPRKGRVACFSPQSEEDLLGLAQFTSEDYSKLQGSVDDDDDMGFIGTWFRMPIYVSTNVEGDNTAGHDNCMFHQDAFALVMQMNPTSHTFFDVDYLAMKSVVEQLYGVKTVRDDHAVWMKAG